MSRDTLGACGAPHLPTDLAPFQQIRPMRFALRVVQRLYVDDR